MIIINFCVYEIYFKKLMKFINIINKLTIKNKRTVSDGISLEFIKLLIVIVD